MRRGEKVTNSPPSASDQTGHFFDNNVLKARRNDLSHLIITCARERVKWSHLYPMKIPHLPVSHLMFVCVNILIWAHPPAAETRNTRNGSAGNGR